MVAIKVKSILSNKRALQAIKIIHKKIHTVKRPRHILLTKEGICLRPGLILHGHFQLPQNVFYCYMWLLKVSMQNESGPEGYLHFCEQDVMWSFYSVGDL